MRPTSISVPHPVQRNILSQEGENPAHEGGFVRDDRFSSVLRNVAHSQSQCQRSIDHCLETLQESGHWLRPLPDNFGARGRGSIKSIPSPSGQLRCCLYEGHSEVCLLSKTSIIVADGLQRQFWGKVLPCKNRVRYLWDRVKRWGLGCSYYGLNVDPFWCSSNTLEWNLGVELLGLQQISCRQYFKLSMEASSIKKQSWSVVTRWNNQIVSASAVLWIGGLPLIGHLRVKLKRTV